MGREVSTRMNFEPGDFEKALSRKVLSLFGPDSAAELARLRSADLAEVREATLGWLRLLGETGYLAAGLTDGKDSPGAAVVQESLASTAPSLFLSVETSTRIFGRLVSQFGTAAQKEEILPGLKEGRLIGAVAQSGNPAKAVPEGDGYRLAGRDESVVNAPIADFVAVAAGMNGNVGSSDPLTGVGQSKGGGAAFFLCRSRSRSRSAGLSVGPRLSTTGYCGTAISAVTLEGCSVTSRDVIGPLEGGEAVRTVRLWEDRMLANAGLGQMQRCFRAAVKHAGTPKGSEKPAMGRQEVGFKLAEMLTLLQTAQLLAYRAAWMDETGHHEAPVLAHCAKVFCTESAEEVASAALQILGKLGYVAPNPVEEAYRDSKYLQISGTPTEMSHIRIGDALLR